MAELARGGAAGKVAGGGTGADTAQGEDDSGLGAAATALYMTSGPAPSGFSDENV